MSSRSQLINLCKTRWLARHNAPEVFGDVIHNEFQAFMNVNWDVILKYTSAETLQEGRKYEAITAGNARL